MMKTSTKFGETEFGFEGRMWDLIVSVPDHCLSFYFVNLIKQSKKAQYTAIIDENNHNPGNIWKLFKEIGINKKSNASTTSLK